MAAVQSNGKVMVDIKSRYDKANPSPKGLHVGDWAVIIKACVRGWNKSDMEPKIAEAFMEMAGDGNEFLKYDVFEHCICRKPLQSEKELRRIFKVVDFDGNGYCDRDEIKGYILKQRMPAFKEETLDKILEKADTNNDGKIDVDEFINCWKGKK